MSFKLLEFKSKEKSETPAVAWTSQTLTVYFSDGESQHFVFYPDSDGENFSEFTEWFLHGEIESSYVIHCQELVVGFRRDTVTRFTITNDYDG